MRAKGWGSSHIRFAAEVTDARWDETCNHWIVRTPDGHVFETQALVTATGQLSRPSNPQLPGVSFRGPLFIPPNCDFRGKRVAVIGTGASAIQFVPAIAPLVSKLYVFQRSAAYVLPKADKSTRDGKFVGSSTCPRRGGSTAC